MAPPPTRATRRLLPEKPPRLSSNGPGDGPAAPYGRAPLINLTLLMLPPETADDTPDAADTTDDGLPADDLARQPYEREADAVLHAAELEIRERPAQVTAELRALVDRLSEALQYSGVSDAPEVHWAADALRRELDRIRRTRRPVARLLRGAVLGRPTSQGTT